MPRILADAPEDSATTIIGVDARGWGADAQIDPNAVGTFVYLDVDYDDERIVTLDLAGGFGDRRVLVNSAQLHAALAAAGVPWVQS